jgi:hypothetical protein
MRKILPRKVLFIVCLVIASRPALALVEQKEPGLKWPGKAVPSLFPRCRCDCGLVHQECNMHEVHTTLRFSGASSAVVESVQIEYSDYSWKFGKEVTVADNIESLWGSAH